MESLILKSNEEESDPIQIGVYWIFFFFLTRVQLIVHDVLALNFHIKVD